MCVYVYMHDEIDNFRAYIARQQVKQLVGTTNRERVRVLLYF